MEKIELSPSQHFEIEKINRAIDREIDIDKLKNTLKALTRAWMIQRSVTGWLMRQNIKTEPLVKELNL
jgi:cystathionine beta-lyase family protein involved in aluminum resistance